MEIKISPAQAKVIPLLKEGCSNQDISKKLNISTRTVESHLASLYNLADVRSRTQFIKWLQSNSVTIRDAAKERSREKVKLAHSLKSQGCSISQIAEQLGIHYSTVSLYLKKPCADIKAYPRFEIITSPPKILCWFWGA